MLVEAHNEEWELTELQIRRSQAARREARAALLPQLSASASVTRNGGVEESVVAGQIVRQRYDWGTGLSASIVLFDGPRYPLYSRSGELVELSRVEASWRRHVLRLETEQTFYVLAASQREVEIAQQAVELRQAYLERAEAMLAADMAIGLDVARARTELLEAQQRVLEARANLGNASDSLSVLIGHADSRALVARLPEFAAQTPPDVARGQLADRADFVAQSHAIAAARYAHDAIWWGLLPRLDLRADWRVGQASVFNPEGTAWSMTLALTWLLYDGGARYARADAAQVEIRERTLVLERSVRRANAELTTALRDWQLAVASIAVANEQILAATEAYEVAQARFESGLATSIEVIDASQALFRAEMARNQTQLRALLATSRYRYLEAIDLQ
ncbi:MAG: TolC family protein [Bradymonadaceae bacterium]|nr:TolC family protein [Lujinxingiaceae bacterium]